MTTTSLRHDPALCPGALALHWPLAEVVRTVITEWPTLKQLTATILRDEGPALGIEDIRAIYQRPDFPPWRPS